MLLLLSWSILSASTPAADTVAVLLRPEPGAMTVSVHYPAAKAGPVRFAVESWAGVEDFGNAILDVGANDEGGALAVDASDGAWVVTRRNASFTLSYTVVSGKATLVGDDRRDLFRPTLLREFAFVWGHAWWLRPVEGIPGNLPVRVSVQSEGYRWARFVPGASSTVATLQRSAVVAGAFRQDSVTVDGVRYRILIQGATWTFADTSFADAICGIVTVQARAMGRLPGRGATVVMMEGRSRSQGGTVEGDVIALYPDPSRPLIGTDPGTLRLVAHEHFHRWNGGRDSGAGERREGYYKWFQEGMTEYLAEVTLLRASLTSPEGFVARVNEKVRAYLTNPAASTATALELAERYWASADYQRLPYDKGFLVGLLVDLRLRRLSDGTRSVDDFLRTVLGGERSGNPARYDDASLLAALGATAGGVTAWEEFYRRYAVGADPLPLDDLCQAQCPRVDEAAFEWGFRTDSNAVTGGAIVTTVVPEGNAAQAGLAVGDSLTGRVSYWNGDPTKEATIEVARGGRLQAIRFLPAAVRSVPRIPVAPWVRGLRD